MNAITTLALKDLRLLSRDKMALFFILAFPLIYGVFFGAVMGTSDKPRGSMNVAVIDNDGSTGSRRFIELLGKESAVHVEPMGLPAAREAVRKGRVVAYLALPKEFGKSAGVFWGGAPEIEVGIDPSHRAESGMLEGFVMQAMGRMIGDRFADPTSMRPQVRESMQAIRQSKDLSAGQRTVMTVFMTALDQFLGSLDPKSMKSGHGPNMDLAKVKTVEVTAELSDTDKLLQRLRSPYEISFPSAIIWGVMGCAAGFAVSLVKERSDGTLLRLKLSPLSRTDILSGKALACGLSIVGVILMMLILGRAAFGVRLNSPLLLTMAIGSTVVCFVGVMMLLSVLGKTEQAVGSAGWACLVVLAMIGGGMIPLLFLPPFMQTLSNISPVKWAIYSLEGAIWRGFTFSEMLAPCAVLMGIGVGAFGLGATLFAREEK